MTSVALNGVTYTDDANAATGMANGGHRVRFIPCLADFVAEALIQLGLQHASRDAAHASELAAHASEIAAATWAASALASPGTSATSTTPLAFGIGEKTLSIQPGKALVIGQFVTIGRADDATQWMHGVITAHDAIAGSLTVAVGAFKGAGTQGDWVIGLSGPDALPAQSGMEGRYLVSNGASASWVVPAEFATLRRQVQQMQSAVTAVKSSSYFIGQF